MQNTYCFRFLLRNAKMIGKINIIPFIDETIQNSVSQIQYIKHLFLIE